VKGELTRREHVIGWAGLVVLIAIFLPWETLLSAHIDGWTTGIVGWGGGMLLAVAGEYLVCRRLGYRLWAPPFGDSWFAAGLAGIGLILVIYRWATLELSPSYGIWIAAAAGAVETVALLDEARRPAAT
jgi:hypothetical protein